MAAAEEGDVDTTDPDYIAAHPPEPQVDPKQYFQSGAHQGKWAEFDDRGVPTKNIKKKKPAKKEKDALEAEFLDAKKKHQEYLKTVEAWEQRIHDAEADLERTDKLRWAFRQVGPDKNAAITVDDLEELFRVMSWDHMTKKEVGTVKKAAEALVNEEARLTLESLRAFTGDRMPALLLEERLGLESLDNVNLEEVYSPRTWRRKLDEYDMPRGEKKDKKDKKSKKESGGSKSPRSPRGAGKKSKSEEGGSKSPREKKEKKSAEGGGSKSPRGRGAAGSEAPKSPRGKKDKKEDKESKKK